MLMLLRVTIFVGVGVEFVNTILRAKVERPAGMFALRERGLCLNLHSTDWIFDFHG
jgi:hypothetical protein